MGRANRPSRRILASLAWLLVLATSHGFAKASEPTGQPDARPARFGDFAAYWTAGRAFLEKQNPFDPEVVRQIAEREGLTQTFVIWNPPWVDPILALFALLPFPAGAVVFCLTNVGLSVLAAVTLARRSGLSEFQAVLATFLFPPIGVCLGMSQGGILVLAGGLLYAWGLERRRPFLAGSALFLCSIKPHVAILLWLFPLLCGSLRERMRTLLGFLAVVGFLSAAAVAWSPQLPVQFLEAVRHPPQMPPTQFRSATLGMWLRLELGLLPHVWVQFVPMFVGGTIAAIVLWRHREKARLDPVGWTCGLLLASAIVLPYGWHYDQPVLLPTVLGLWGAALARGGETPLCPHRRRFLATACATLFLSQAVFLVARLEEHWHFVFPLAWGALAAWKRWVGGACVAVRDEIPQAEAGVAPVGGDNRAATGP